MNDEWKKQHTRSADAARDAIWTPNIMGDWRPSAEIVARVDVSGKVVLDFGAGVGRNTMAIMDAGAEAVVSYDHAEMLRWMPPELPCSRVPVGKEDIVETDSIDVVFCSLVLQHLTREELALALRFINRVLRASGCILIYGRDCGDPPECRPIWPEIADRFRVCWMEQLPTEDQFSHSVSMWRK